MSPGTGPNIEFGISTGGLDFMSSSGYPRIQFGYDDATDNEEESEEDEDEVSTNPDEPGPNGGGNQRHNLLVSRFTNSPSPFDRKSETCPSDHLEAIDLLISQEAQLAQTLILTLSGPQTN
jgi:eukaryotic translation initiation factor 2-alpha kinase 4